MKVAIDVTPLLGPTTGVGIFTRSLVDELADMGDIDVVPYALTLRGFRKVSQRLPAGIHHRPLPMPAGVLMAIWERWGHPGVQWWTGGVNVVHGTNFVVPPSRSSLRRPASRSGTARLVTVHDLACVHYPQLCSPTSLRYPASIKAAIASGAHVHTLSSFVAAEVMEWFGVEPERVHVIAPAPAPAPTSSAANNENETVIPAEGEYLLAIGTLEPRKDYPTLIRAFDQIAADFPDLRLLIAGAAGWAIEEFHNAHRAARHADRIVHLGYVDDYRRAALLHGARAMVFPSIYEGFGLPPLEAMQAGVPVIATRAGAVPEAVGDAALLVPVGDKEALAEAIVAVLKDQSIRNRLVNQGKIQAEKFTWRQTALSFSALYQQLASAG